VSEVGCRELHGTRTIKSERKKRTDKEEVEEDVAVSWIGWDNESRDMREQSTLPLSTIEV